MYEIAPCKIFLAQTIWTRNKECRRNQAEWISQNSSFTKLFGMIYHDLPYQHETLLFLTTYIWSQFVCSCTFFLFEVRLKLVINWSKKKRQTFNATQKPFQVSSEDNIYISVTDIYIFLICTFYFFPVFNKKSNKRWWFEKS